jgi:predicted ester cyclase
MSIEQNKALVRRIVEELQNRDNWALLDELVDPAFVNWAAPPGIAPDRTGIIALSREFGAAFPDGAMTIEEMVAEGDLVVTRKTFRGTHQASFMGIAATGRRVAISLIDWVRVAEGRAIEHWNVADMMSLLQQLGAMPVVAPFVIPG